MVDTERSKKRRHSYYSGRQRRRSRCLASRPLTKRSLHPSRPIVSACSCPTELISSYFDKTMEPIVKTLPWCIKDSQHALEIFHDFNFFGRNKLISLWKLHLSILSLLMTKVSGPSNIFFDRRTVKEPSSEMTTPSSRTSANTQLLFIRWQLLQTNQWRGHGC